MKIRDGFVSNSSSTSYVVIGVRLTVDDVNSLISQLKDEGEDEWDVINRIQGPYNLHYIDDVPNNNVVVGWGDSCSDDGCPFTHVESPIGDIIEQVARSMGEISTLIPKFTGREIKIYTGTRYD